MDPKPLKIYSLICSRDNNHSKTTLELFSYFKDAGIETKSLIKFDSIFNAYECGIKRINPNPEDIIILCHDDIEIKNSKEEFIKILTDNTKDPGFIGVAGTKHFNRTGIWWNWSKPIYMSGRVDHGLKGQEHGTYFGPYGNTVVMDGVFLACNGTTAKGLKWLKPSAFTGKWDFYDLFYTFQSYLLGFTNRTVPIMIRHESPGQMRESWHKNREAFISMYNDKLPAEVK